MAHIRLPLAAFSLLLSPHGEAHYLRLLALEIDWVINPPVILPWGHRSFYFRDPDGNFLNFYSRVVEG